MAKRGVPLIDTDDPKAFVREHARLLALHEHGVTVPQLCGMFETSYVTIYKWLRTPVGTLPKRLAKKEREV